jgi:hypothetical protein
MYMGVNETGHDGFSGDVHLAGIRGSRGILPRTGKTNCLAGHHDAGIADFRVTGTVDKPAASKNSGVLVTINHGNLPFLFSTLPVGVTITPPGRWDGMSGMGKSLVGPDALPSEGCTVFLRDDPFYQCESSLSTHN